MTDKRYERMTECEKKDMCMYFITSDSSGDDERMCLGAESAE